MKKNDRDLLDEYRDKNYKLQKAIEVLNNKLKYQHLKKKLYKIRVIGWWYVWDEDKQDNISEGFDTSFSAIDYFDSIEEDPCRIGEELKTFNIVDLRYKNEKFIYDDGYADIEQIWINGVLEYDSENKDDTKTL